MRSTGTGGGDFEDWLRREFALTLGLERGWRSDPAQAVYAAAAPTRWRTFMALRSSVLAAVSAKAVFVGAAAALATGGAAAAVATGSVKPDNWGQQVVQTVRDCKAERGDPGSGTRGIGSCVSSAASQHGGQQRAAHSSGARLKAPAGPSPLPGKRPGPTQNGPPGKNGGAPGASQGQGNAHGHGNQALPTPAASHGQ